jgi:hypothetical protein
LLLKHCQDKNASRLLKSACIIYNDIVKCKHNKRRNYEREITGKAKVEGKGRNIVFRQKSEIGKKVQQQDGQSNPRTP